MSVLKDHKLKIVYVAPRFHPYKAGAENNLLQMAKRMAEKGHDVSVFTTDFKFRDLQPPKFEEYKGIKIYRHRSFIEAPIYLAFVPGLLISILRTDADVIHVTGIGFIWFEFCLSIKKIWITVKNFLGRLLKRNSYKPCVTKFIDTPHGPFMAFSYGKDESKVRQISRNIYTFYLKHFVPWMYDRVIAVVPKQKEWMKKLYNIQEEQVAVIPNGIEKSYLELEAPIFEKNDKVIITYLNRMEWYKGIQTVLEAIQKLKRQEKYRESRKDLNHKPLPPYEFWIMGRPTKYTETLKKMIVKYDIGEHIRFVYTPSDEERDEIFLEKSQINILPSKWEATGLVLIEAMAKGNVLITTYQNEGHDLIIKEGESGYVYEFGDDETLTKILRNLLEDYKLRQSIIKHNVEFAKHFTWEAIFPLYEELVLSLL